MIATMQLPRRIKDRFRTLVIPRVPSSLKRNFVGIGAEGIGELEDVLRRHYFGSDDRYLGTAEGRDDLQDHLLRRLRLFRATVVPWLDSVRPLRGLRILEIGCGTGSSSVALAEQGATVVGIDIAGKSLEVARARCRLYSVEAAFREMNATDAPQLLSSAHYDMVIFFAALEHMTQGERLQAMRGTWGAMCSGDLWCLIDTPNRLWYFDSHTAMLPFFFWLPDELALQYARHRRVIGLSASEADSSEEAMLRFLRKGRGVSFHEFELCMNGATGLDVLGSLGLFLRQKSLPRRLLWTLTDERRYESFLARVGPRIHRGFYQPSLDLIIRKP